MDVWRGVAAGKAKYKAELCHYFPDMHKGRRDAKMVLTLQFNHSQTPGVLIVPAEQHPMGSRAQFPLLLSLFPSHLHFIITALS